MRIGTMIMAAVLAAVAVAVLIGAQSFPEPVALGSPGAARLPTLYAVALLVLSGVLAAAAAFGLPEPALRFTGIGRVFALAILTAAYIILLPYAGFLVLSVPWLFLAVMAAGGNLAGSALTALVVPASVYVIFGLMLGVPLP